jgi:cellulose synthase operon protein C
MLGGTLAAGLAPAGAARLQAIERGYIALAHGDPSVALAAFVEALGHDDPTNEAVLLEIGQLTLGANDEARLARALEKLVETTRHDGVRARARHRLGHLLRARGDLKAARRQFDALGFVRDVRIIGAFENSQNSGYATAYPPETEWNMAATYPGKRTELRWRRGDFSDDSGTINLANYIDPWMWAVAYFATAFEADADRIVHLHLAADDDVKVFLNGRQVFASDTHRGAVFDAHVVPLALKQGANRLLVKVAQRTGDWEVALRLTTPDGVPVSLPVAADNAPAVAASEATPQPAATFNEILARRTGEGPKAPAAALEALLAARARELSGFRKEAITRLETLTGQFPKFTVAQFFLARVYQNEDNPGRAVELMKAAIATTPDLFAARLALSLYYTGNDRPDRGYEILTALLADTPDYGAARRQSIEYCITKGFLPEALRRAKRLVEDRPDNHLNLRSLARVQRAMGLFDESDQSYRHALELRATDTTALQSLISSAIERRRYGDARALHERLLKFWPNRPEEYLRMANLALRESDYPTAETDAARAAALSPDYYKPYRTIGEIRERQGRRGEALKAFRQALTLSPDKADLRDYVSFLDPTVDPVIARYRLSCDEADALRAKAVERGEAAEAAGTNDAALVALDYAVTRVNADGSSRELVHRIVHIRNDAGVKRFNRIGLPGSINLKLHRAVTIFADGREVDATSIDSGEMRFAELEPGATLEYEYEYDRNNNGWIDEHYYGSFYFQDSDPVMNARWVLAVPKSKRLTLSASNPKIEQATGELATNDGEALQVYDFRARDVPRIEEDDRRPPIREISMWVDVTTVPDWAFLAAWQNALIKDQFDVNEPIREKVRQLTQNAKTPFEKLVAIYNFITGDIRYLYADVGIFGKKPDLCINIFSNKFGDCKDKATLMIAMLREAGITAHYAGVRTRDRGPVNRAMPSAQTNHVITWVPAQPGLDKPLFLDGTAQFHRWDALPAGDQGTDAFILDGKGYEYVAIPFLPPGSTSQRVEYSHALQADGGTVASQRLIARGGYAASVRSRLVDKSQRDKRIEKMVAGGFKGATIDAATTEGIDDVNRDAVVEARFHAPAYAQKDGADWTVHAANLIKPAQGYARSGDRHYDLMLGSPTDVEAVHTFKPPEGYRFVKPGDDALFDSPWFRFSVAYQLAADGTLTVTHRQTVKTERVPLAGYAEFRALCVKAEAEEGRAYRAVPAGSVSGRATKGKVGGSNTKPRAGAR